jgi:hypothetical protein
MSQYRSTGGLDDAIASDGDKAFNSVNLRDQLNQLLLTEVRESVNGRMEGYWKPRKSVESRTGALVSGGNPLQLPLLIVGTSIAITNATRSGNTVTLTTASAHGLTTGSRLSIEGIGYASGTDPNGLFVAIAPTSSSTITYTVTGAAGSYTTSAISVLTTTSKKISAAAFGSGVVTITIFEAHGLTTGDFVSIQDVVFTTGTNPNGKFQITVTNTTQFTYALASGAGSYTVVNALANKLSTAITTVAYASNLVTLTVATHGVVVGQTGNAIINGITFAGVDYNGVVSLTAATSTTFTFETAGVTNATIVGTTPSITQILVNDSAAGNVRASCLFSNPNEQSKEYVIVALDTVAKKIDLDTYAVTTITYPASQTVDAFTDMQQCFDKVILFRDRKQALVWDGTSAAFTVMAGGNYTQPVIIDNGGAATNTVTVGGVTTVTHNATTNLVEGDIVEIVAIGNGAITGPVIGDQYSVASTLPSTHAISNVSNLTPFTTVTITIGAHHLLVASTVTVSGLATAGAGNPNGDFVITAVTGNTISYTVSTLTATVTLGTTPRVSYLNAFQLYVNWEDHANHSITFTKPQSSGGGFMHLPGAPWGTYFQRRLFVPYYYDQSGTSTIAWTDRNIRDEVAISDILDENTYDQIYNQFRISGGTADQVVAMHGFFDDTMIVLNRNSIHSISNTSGNLTDTVVRELTGEVGCLARKTVLMRGNTMYFLSDNGVYGLEFLNDYNLRGMDQPLSKNIQPYIDRINPDKADKAVAVYFDNRYFLAVPLDSVAGANDAIGNNAVLVYNFLNKGWESIDTYGNNQFIITDYITASGGVRNNLYTVTSNGGLHQMEFAESIQDRLSVSNLDNTIVTPQIAASLTSRGYNFNSLERKRFTDTQIQMQNLAGETGEYSISFAAEDPDFASTIGTTSTFLGGMLTPSTANEAETATIRCRIGGVRGFTGTLILNRTQGSPKIHSIMVAGSVTNRQIISQK